MMRAQRISSLLTALGLTLSFFTLSASAQCPSADFTSSDAASGDTFGASMAIDGDTLLVAAPTTDHLGNENSGTVYRFERTATGFVEQEAWEPFDPRPFARFGESVDIAGNWAVVGAPRTNEGAPESGSAYLWQRVGTSWVPGQKLIPSIVGFTAQFGFRVAIVDGVTPRVAVSAFRQEYFGASQAGAVFIFEFDSMAGLWSETQVIRSSDLTGGDRFGRGLAMDGDRLVVGADMAGAFGFSAGAVYVFDLVGATFLEQARLLEPVPANSGKLGYSVRVQGDRIIATGRRAHVFELQAGQWAWDAQLPTSYPLGNSQTSLDLSGDSVLIGDPSWGTGGGSTLLSKGSGSWLQTGMTSQVGLTEFHGSSALFAGDTLLVSSSPPGENPALPSGEVHTYPLTMIDCNNNGIADGCDIYAGTSLDADMNGVPDECAASGNYCSSSPNSSGGPAVAGFTGSTSVSSNSLTLTAGTVPNTPGLFFCAQSQLNSPFGNGRLCVGPPLFRLPTLSASGNQASFTYDLTLPPQPSAQVLPGSTWNFQYWFRDPGVGASFDTSDGLSLTFVP